jgi:hypothetical protein
MKQSCIGAGWVFVARDEQQGESAHVIIRPQRIKKRVREDVAREAVTGHGVSKS